ncbi:hypothetical protein ACFWPH_32740 [Nocardia sp. NPDC058499]|uniref:hypothetical protein n=1 Tax=Nocardia sp. NPDC058499 TaxID=3346530 RepID=UPI003650762A
MDLKDLMATVIDTLYAGLTGGSTELPLPDNINLNWMMPGIPFHESAFDFAIAGPYAPPTRLTLPDFGELVDALMGEGGVDRTQAIEDAKIMYQGNLLGGWEQWSRLVDFIPNTMPTQATSQWSATPGAGKHKHVSVVYSQSNRTLSQVYKDTLERCEVADEELTATQKEALERARALLGQEVEVEGFLGEKEIEYRDSRAMTMYTAKKLAYENAVIDYASRLARANNGTAADLVEWQRSGGIYRNRATQALRDWDATGYKSDIERAQAQISHILGSSMVRWKENLLELLDDIDNNTNGAFGYSFFPASVLPGSFARSPGWSRFEEHKLHQRYASASRSYSASGRAGISFGLFSVGGSGGRTVTEYSSDFRNESFGMSFEYTTVEIMRPAFNPSWFLSTGWRPKDTFIRDYGKLHSDGKKDPSGAMIGYPTKALFIRDLRINSSELSSLLNSYQSSSGGGASFGFGPFSLGGSYQQSNRRHESVLDIQGSSIHVRGLQLVGFLSVLFPQTANPNSEVKKWI